MELGMLLVVDDDKFQRDVLALQLSGLGWKNVCLAANGEEALQHFEQHGKHISAIVADLSMPEMDGLVLMRHLAQRGFQAGIILLSGMHQEILHSAAALASAHGLNILGVLTKPCTPGQLQLLLADLQRPSGAQRASLRAHALTSERLKEALAGNEFIPWYQPKIDIQTGNTVGVEVLARWPAENGSMIGPASFIPALESAGLADDLFFSIAQQAATDMALWRGQNLCFTAAINMSMDTAHNLAMPERVGRIVRDSGLQASDFIIEVTESRLMAERSLALETLTRLSLMGFVLSIDDFGTGYSSLVQLIDLPFRELKIDASFVQRANLEPKARAVLRIAIMLGVNLEMSVIAEGVETAEQLEFLRGCGGSIVQGYHIARPMPFAACTQWLESKKAQAPVAGS
jgi:EAL domain-containing protein (putative c-di-GMP-specific phosphodiesterase class I)/CheY-like chemotaxis protein